MRKLFALLILLAAPAWAATYYVKNGGSDAASGLSDELAWETIAKVNGSSFSPGDSILFKRDSTWREQLTVPSSGTNGSPITFGAYGSGAVPILDGSNLITPGSSWTEVPAAPTIAEQQTSGTTPVATRVLTASMVTAQGFKSDISITVPYIDINVRKAGSPTGNVWIEVWASSGTPARPAGGDVVAQTDLIDVSTLGASFAWTRFTFTTPPTLTAGAVYFLLFNGDYAPSDTVNAEWALNTADNYRGDDPYCRFRLIPGWPPTFSAAWNHDFAFKVYKVAASSAIWTATVTTEPKIVFFDGTTGTKVANQAACTSEGKYYWAANVLSVYSATDPDTAYTSPGIEAGARYGVWGNSKNYVTYDGLKFTKANSAGLNLDSSNHAAVQNCEVSYAGEYGIVYGTASGDNLVDLCNIHHNGWGSDVGSGIFTWADAATVGHENYIRRSTVANNRAHGIHVNSNYYTIEYNEVKDNGSTDAPYGANGIEVVNLANDGYAQHIIVRHNKVHGQISGLNDGSGIAADDYARYVDIYGNLSYGNDGPGIGSWKAKDINIYNNTCYGNMLDSGTSHTTGGEISLGSNAADTNNLVVKNNIGQATGATYPAIRVDAQAYGSAGLSITNNCWYAIASNWYFWNATGGNNLATWNALTGVGTDLNSDPSFTNAAGGDFTLQAGSPCIEKGVNLGTSYLEQLLAGSTWPAAVETMDWHKTGGAPDVGAYGYRKVIW